MTQPKPPMTLAASPTQIDAATNAYMRKVIGERLCQHLGTEAPMPDRLQKLLDQLRKQDDNAG